MKKETVAKTAATAAFLVPSITLRANECYDECMWISQGGDATNQVCVLVTHGVESLIIPAYLPENLPSDSDPTKCTVGYSSNAERR